MEELKKVFPNSKIEVRLDNERLTQYGVTIPMHIPISIEEIANIDKYAHVVALGNELYISLIIYKTLNK